MSGPSPLIPPSRASVDVVARGLLRGREVEGPARLEFEERLRLVFRDGGARVQLAPHDLEGVEADPRAATLVLFLRGGDALELEGGAALEAVVERWATRLPELTRDLRAVGTRRAVGAEHDRFFAPLLDARRRAEGAAGWEEQRAAFEPGAIRRTLEHAMAEFAASRHPESAPDRRALEAELEEYLGCVHRALDRVAEAGARLGDAPRRQRLVAWREWAAAVRRVFVEADRCWLDSRPVLAAIQPPAPAPEPGLVGRILGRRRGRV
ncbi:MAG TPA: hypothetical protein VGE02_10915 [Gemmatimonadales bacterium]